MTAVRVSMTVHPDDNVATVLDNQTGLTRQSSGEAIDRGIPFGHKVALVNIEPGEAIIKYGVTIGHATQAIRRGEHVHIHNVC